VAAHNIRDYTAILNLTNRNHSFLQVRIIKCDHNWVKQAARENLRHALRAALLMLPSTFTSEQLFLALAGLSYIGDFRMVFGENPNKVANIVTKSMDHFHKLYDPVLEVCNRVHVSN
jgi:translocator assembly and maintenance protein 41